MSPFRKNSDKSRTDRRVRPELTQLEDRTVPSFFAGNFSNGVWRYYEDGSSRTEWKHLSWSQASLITIDGYGDVCCEFKGSGVWRYQDYTHTWQHLTSSDASELAINADWGPVYSNVVCEFSTGVWLFGDRTGWQHLTVSHAAQVAIDVGGVVYGEFPGWGVWRYEDSTGWVQFTHADASSISANSDGVFAGEFPGYGVWRYDDGTKVWQQLTNVDAYWVKIDQNFDVMCEFSNGVWRYDDDDYGGGFSNAYNHTGWQQLTTANAFQGGIGAAAVAGHYFGEVFGAFSTGVWFYDETGWHQLTSEVPTVMAAA
jgi:hypothetical protein